MSAFGVILVRIQSECGKILTRITPNMDTFHTVDKSDLIQGEFGKFRGSSAIVGTVGLVSSCPRGYFVRPNFFSRGYFIDPNFFLVGILWVQFFFTWLIS